VDISAPSTLKALQRLWSRWADESASARGEYQNKFNVVVREATDGGRLGFSALGISSIQPSIGSGAIDVLRHDYNNYWARGTTDR
jgi:hypothetical protein